MAITTELDTGRIPVPHEEGEWFVFKKPSWVDLEEASESRRLKALQQMRGTREILGAEILTQIRSEAEAAQEAAKSDTTAVAKVRTAEEVLEEYDRLLLLKCGIKAWSYPEPVTVDAIKALDSVTAKWAGLTLVALAESGFTPAMPTVETRDDGVIEVRPGELDPTSSTSTFTASSAAPRTNETDATQPREPLSLAGNWNHSVSR